MNNTDGLDKAEQMLIDYSNKKNIEKPTRPHADQYYTITAGSQSVMTNDRSSRAKSHTKRAS